MATTAPSHAKKSVSAPDEIRAFPNDSGFMKVLELGDETLGYCEFRPGWKWSKDMKPKVGGDTCQANHNIYVISGRMHIEMSDGSEFEVGPGDAAHIAPGHDAWVLGDEPMIALDWTAARTYGK